MFELNYKIADNEKYILITVSGSIDIYNTSEIKQVIPEVLEKKKTIIMDIENLDYIDSSGIFLLISFQKEAQENKLEFYLYKCNEKIRNIFRITKILELFKEITSFPE